MPTVNISINNKNYQILCDTGEESRIHELALKLDNKIKNLANQFSNVNDIYLMVLQSLIYEDKLDELSNKTKQSDLPMSESIEVIAEYVESLAQKIEVVYNEV